MKAKPLRNFITIKAIESALKKPAPNRIPISSPGCLKNNFYSVKVNFPDGTFVADKNFETAISGLFFNKDVESGLDCFLLKDLLKKQEFHVEITHYYNRYGIIVETGLSYFLRRMLFLHLLIKYKDVARQKIFNKKRLVRRDRIEVLAYLTERSIKEPDANISSLSLGVGLYSKRWFYHPERQELQAYLSMLLGSLEESGDLKKVEYYYKVSPKALVTLSEFERDEQKHRDILLNGRKMVMLTAALVAVTVMQSNLFAEGVGLAVEFVMGLINDTKLMVPKKGG